MKYATTILVFCVAALLSLGLVMLYSSSMSPTGASYSAAQVIWCGLGLIAAGIVACVDYRHLKKTSIALLLVAVVLLAVAQVLGRRRVVGGERGGVGGRRLMIQTPGLAN